MINYFLITIVAIASFSFLRGRAKSSIRPSYIKALFYFVVTTIVAAFYYKTNQVAEIYDYIDVQAFRSAYKDGKIKDTVASIDIINNFDTHMTSTNLMSTIAQNQPELDSLKVGGIVTSIKYRPGDSICNNTKRERQLDGILKFLNISQCDQLYVIHTMQTSFPRLINISPYIAGEVTEKDRGIVGLSQIEIGDTIQLPFGFHLKNLETGESKSSDYFSSAVKQSVRSANVLSLPQNFDYKGNGGFTTTPYCMSINKLNFFSACDISQYNYMLQVNSDVPVEKLSIKYNVPFECDINGPEGSISKGPYNLFLYKKYLDCIINEGTFSYHIKLPTLANLQTIRSLILTTILTILITLFLTQAHSCIRAFLIKYRRKHPTRTHRLSVKRIKLYRRFNGCIAIVVSVLCLYGIYRLFINKPFLIKNNFVFDNIGWVTFAVFALLFIANVLVRRYAKRPITEEEWEKQKNNKPEEQKESTPITFGIFNESTPDDIDKVFEEHYKEINLSADEVSEPAVDNDEDETN